MRAIVFLFCCWAFIGSLFAQEVSGEGTSRQGNQRWQVKTPEELREIGYRAYHQGDWPLVLQSLGEAVRTFTDNDLLYLYLGTAHQILGNDLQAEETLIYGVNLQGENMQKIAFVLGNYYYSVGHYAKAVDAYNLATWGDKQMVQSFLNRANLYLSLGFYSNALNDYSYFLFRKPFNSQRSNIEAIIQKLIELGGEGRIQAEQKVVAGDDPPEYPYPGAYDGETTGGASGQSFGVRDPNASNIGASTNSSGVDAGQTTGADNLGTNQASNDAANSGNRVDGSDGAGLPRASGNTVGQGPNQGAGQGSDQDAREGLGQATGADNLGANQASNDAANNGNGVDGSDGAGLPRASGNTVGQGPDQGAGQGSDQDARQATGAGNSGANQPSNGMANNGAANNGNRKNPEENGRGNSLEDGIYRRPKGDTGNTVGTGGSFQAQMRQLNRVRNSLGQLNRSAIILNRASPDLIEQQQIFPEIDE